MINDHGLAPKYGGFVVPMEYFDQPRGGEAAFTTTGAAGTISTMADVSRAGQFLIDMAPILQLVETITGLEGNLEIPVTTAGPTAVAAQEVSTPADGGGTFANPAPSLTPHRVDTQIQISMQSVIQTGGWIDQFLRTQLGMSLSQQMSQFILVGTGSNNQITGLVNQTGITAQTYAIADKGKWGKFVDMEEAVATNLIPEIRRAYVLQTDLYYKGRQTPVDPGSGIFSIRDGRVLGSPDEAYRTMGMVGGDVPAHKTVLLPTNNGLYAEWSEVFVGIWRAMEVITDNITQPGNVKITAIAFFDMALRRPKAVVHTSQA